MSFEATETIWMNGELVPWAKAQVHVMSHALHYGSSVFEGIRVYATHRGPCAFRMSAHSARLVQSARIHRIPLRYSADEIDTICREVFAANGLESGYLRPLCWQGYGAFGLDPTNCEQGMMVAALRLGRYLGAKAVDEGIDVCVSSWARLAPNTLPAMAKAGGNYLAGTAMQLEARRNGFTEAIALGTDGTVSEGAGENLFAVVDGRLYTPGWTSSILIGITRNAVMAMARDLGFEVIERPIPREMLYVADELFFCGTAAEVTPIRSVDRIDIGSGEPGPVTRAIRARFFGLFDGSTDDVHQWLEPMEVR